MSPKTIASVAILIGGLLTAFGGWAIVLPTWNDALAPANVSGLLLLIATVVGEWVHRRPANPGTASTGQSQDTEKK